MLSQGGSITDVAGIEVGHATDLARGSGCTVVLCRGGAVGGVDVRGSAPGTRETDLLRPTSHVSEVHAVVLGGGSAFGLDAASGVVRFLAERDIGYRAGPVTVPIVPAAILFDIGIAKHGVHPGKQTMGMLRASMPRTAASRRGASARGRGLRWRRRWGWTGPSRAASARLASTLGAAW